MFPTIGNEYSIEEIEKIFNTKFGTSPKGINPRKGKDKDYLLLFSRAKSHYPNRIENDILYYIGEGKDPLKDQIMTRGNKRLANSEKDNRVIYGFAQEKDKKNFKYIGILKLLGFSEKLNDNEAKIFEFYIKLMGINSYEEIESEIKDIKSISTTENPSLTQKSILSSTTRKARSYAFSKIVKSSFEYKCAVCKKQRRNKKGHYEVEAAHIYPKEKNGSDDPRNGLALCKLHHWAFDNGLFTLDDDYSVLVADWIKKDVNYKEIYEYEHHKIKIPKNERLKPHLDFIKAHRELHGF